MDIPLALSDGPGGAPWFLAEFVTDPNGPTEHLIGGRFDPATHAAALFPIPPGLDGTLSMSPGPDGAVWFSGVASDPRTRTPSSGSRHSPSD